MNKDMDLGRITI